VEIQLHLFFNMAFEVRP